MRRLFALVLVCVGIVLVHPTAASAACTNVDPVAGLTTAPVVFTGVVQSSAASKKAHWVAQVTVDHIYKGAVTTNSVQVGTDRGAGRGCGAGKLVVGQRYLFEVAPQADTWKVQGGKSGAAPATDALLAQVQSVLGAGTLPVAPAPTPASVSYARVGAVKPHRLSRVAAPGVALVIVGALGLVFVRRRRTA